MVFTEATIDNLLERIRFQKVVREDTLIPNDDRNNFIFPGTNGVVALQPKFQYVVDLEHFLWDRNNAFFDYMCKLEGREIYESRSKEVIQPKFIALVGTLFENAFWHGNNNNPDLPVVLRIYEGDKGHVLTIKDSGNGFDYKKKLQMLKSGEVYFQFQGAGLKSVDEYKWEVAYSPAGNEAHVLYQEGMLWNPPNTL